MRGLIVNADGFGFTFGNNRAIMEVLEAGFVRSVSANVTWPAVRQIAEITRNYPHVSIGIHLNLSVGPPVLPATDVPSLVSGNGEFHGARFPRRAMSGSLDREEMRRELRAQIEVLRGLGVPISHWDSHQGRHNFPGFFEAAVEVAKEYGIRGARSHAYYPLLATDSRLMALGSYYWARPQQIPTHVFKRWQTWRVRRAGFLLPDRRIVLSGLWRGASSDPKAWELMLQKLPSGMSFIECHPGYPDDTLRKYSSMVESRRLELDMLLGEPWAETADALGVKLCSHFDLPGW